VTDAFAVPEPPADSEDIDAGLASRAFRKPGGDRRDKVHNFVLPAPILPRQPTALLRASPRAKKMQHQLFSMMSSAQGGRALAKKAEAAPNTSAVSLV